MKVVGSHGSYVQFITICGYCRYAYLEYHKFG